MAANVAELFGVFANGTYAAVSNDVERVLGRPGRTMLEFAETLA